MENYTIKQLDELIKEKSKLMHEISDQFTATLTPEQQILRANIHIVRSRDVEDLHKQREELRIQELIKKAKEEDPLIKEIIKEVSSPLAATLEIKPDKVRHHYLFPLVTKVLNARCHVWLVGPAGSGKSTLAAATAAKLNLPYAALSVCSQTTKTDLLGYMDAQGVYRSTSFRQAYENGGIFCLDEIDNGNANVLAVLNSALANDSNEFPDRAVKRHADFVVIACANTFGLGATSGYVGRVQIDAATLDRFFFIEMPYDDGLESHVAGYPGISSPQWDNAGQKVPTVESWLETVKKTRDTIVELGIKAIISPRATYIGIALIKQGVPIQFLEKGLLYKAMSPNTIDKIRQA